MKYFFILGRNPELSRAEVISFLKARGKSYSEEVFDENLLVFETNLEEINIQGFGGVLKFGKILFEGNGDDFEVFLGANELIEEDKFSFAVFGNADLEILKAKFKNEKKKAMLRHGRQFIKFQNEERVNLPNAEHYLFFYKSKKKIYFGIVGQDYSYEEVKRRDMEKPNRRESLAISPRLAKILVNLSGAVEGETLLDPFCGVGGIIQEALIKGINCYGVDRDIDAIKQAKENLAWLKKNYDLKARITFESNNSRNVRDMQFDAIATETPLGEILTKKPNDALAKKIIKNFESVIIPILQRIKEVKKRDAKIAITFPAMRNICVDVERIKEETGLRIYTDSDLKFPIKEFRKDQFISREIFVFI